MIIDNKILENDSNYHTSYFNIYFKFKKSNWKSSQKTVSYSIFLYMTSSFSLFLYIYELLYTQNFQKHQLLPAVHNHTKLLVSFQKHPQILHIRSVWKKITKEPIHTLKDEMLMLVDTSTPAI